MSIGFKNSQPDKSLFVYNSNNVIVHILIYVDDIIFGSDRFFKRMHLCFVKTFFIKGLGALNFILGIEIIRDI